MRETAKKQDAIDLIAGKVNDLLYDMHRDAGIPLEVSVPAAHAQIVTMMAAMIGGEDAYRRCQRAGEIVRPMISLSDAMLASSTPAGSA